VTLHVRPGLLPDHHPSSVHAAQAAMQAHAHHPATHTHQGLHHPGIHIIPVCCTLRPSMHGMPNCNCMVRAATTWLLPPVSSFKPHPSTALLSASSSPCLAGQWPQSCLIILTQTLASVFNLPHTTLLISHGYPLAASGPPPHTLSSSKSHLVCLGDLLPTRLQ